MKPVHLDDMMWPMKRRAVQAVVEVVVAAEVARYAIRYSGADFVEYIPAGK